MERTESKSLQVHPSDEQHYIEIMQVFHWNLKSSQEVKTKDSHLENRSGALYSVTESENYVKLVFERLYDFPNRDKLIALENEYFSMNYQTKGKYKIAIIVSLLAVVVLSLAVGDVAALLAIAGGIGWIVLIWQGNKKKEQQCDENDLRRQKIIAEANRIQHHS